MGTAQTHSGQRRQSALSSSKTLVSKQRELSVHTQNERDLQRIPQVTGHTAKHISPQYTIGTVYPTSVTVSSYHVEYVDTKFQKNAYQEGWTLGSDSHLEFVIKCFISPFKKLTYERHTFNNTSKKLQIRLCKVHPPPPKRGHNLMRKIFLNLLNWDTCCLNYPLPSCQQMMHVCPGHFVIALNDGLLEN